MQNPPPGNSAPQTESFEICDPGTAGGLFFLCDHASNAIPGQLGTLGLPPEQLDTHIAYDIGAAELTRFLAREFGCRAILGRWSRLVVDLNRGDDDPTVVAKLSDRRIILGNAHLDHAAIQARIAVFHAPYHERITAEIDAGLSRGIVPVLVSMHSFTPVWRGFPRPWHIGVLWDRDGRLARPLMEEFAALPGVWVGDNEPYCGALENDCLNRHGTNRGLPHVLIEVRQDLIGDRAGRELWQPRIAGALRRALQRMGPASILSTPTENFRRTQDG